MGEASPENGTFLSFAALLSRALVPAKADIKIEAAATAASDPVRSVRTECVCALAGARLLGELNVLRVAALEACERACREAVRRLALEVLARELQLAPVDIAQLVNETLRTLAAEEPFEVAVASYDAPRLSGALRVVEDASLEPGDLVVRVRDGFVDVRKRVRLAGVLLA